MYFILFGNCIPVKGAKRSIVCDLQRGTFDFIPNDLYNILVNFKNTSFIAIKDKFGVENEKVITEYFSFLVEQSYGFFADNNEDVFPEISLDYEVPEIITNAIVEFDNINYDSVDLIRYELDEIRCKSLQIKIVNKNVPALQIEVLLSKFKDSSLRYIEMIIPFNKEYSIETYKHLSLINSRLSYIIVYNSEIDQSEEFSNDFSVDFCSKDLSSVHMCGVISPHYFRTSVKGFTLSVNYNNCLYKKIAIASNGDIKNCLHTDRVFGKIGITSLKEIAISPIFNELGKIKKDDIEICKDCEFRYICSDCRAFTQAGIKSKPLKCKYDPYLADWV